MIPDYKNCIFTKSAADLKGCPDDSTHEIAFAGRSNAGKSSALNYLTQNKIARTSKTPGRTQLINFFNVGDHQYLVDLPGYGYAKVSKSVKEKWQQSLTEYLEYRKPLIGIIIVMDCRHPLQPFDQNMLNFCYQTNLKAHILLTKSDKLSNNQQKNTLFSVEKQINKQWSFASVQLLSATKKTGVDELVLILNDWFNQPII